MAVAVSITIVGRTYEISCDEGQEDYVRSLAAEVDRRAGDLLRSVGQVGDARLLVMVTLLMADELAELRRFPGAAAAAQHEAAQARRIEEDMAGQVAQLDMGLAEGLTALAGRIDAIAERLEKA